jgi:hypothetical protein
MHFANSCGDSIFGICEDVLHFSQHSYNVSINTHNGQLTLHTDSHAGEEDYIGRQIQLLYSETALSRKPFGIGHMYIYTLLLRMTDTMTSQNIDLSSWDTLYIEGEVLPASVFRRNFLKRKVSISDASRS